MAKIQSNDRFGLKYQLGDIKSNIMINFANQTKKHEEDSLHIGCSHLDGWLW